LQGLCEVMERYALCELYSKELSPPSISLDEFRGTPVYEKILELKQNTRLKVEIKDCSLGKGLPVLGLLIIDYTKNVYSFSLGADFVPWIAVERCVNEMYQGKFIGLPINKLFEFDSHSSVISDIDSSYLNMKKITTNYTGYWPVSIFKDNPSYEFIGFADKLGESNEFDLKYSFDLIEKLGYNIYIRDASKLGFPAFHVLVPGMSQMTLSKSNILVPRKLSYLRKVQKLGGMSQSEVTELGDFLCENYDLLKILEFKNLSLFYLPTGDTERSHLAIELLIFMILYYSENFIKAKEYLDIYLSDLPSDTDQYSYYFAISDFINFKYKKKFSDNETEAILSKMYTPEIATEVANDLHKPSEIFQYWDFPNCFHCDECKSAESCKIFNLLAIEKKIDEYIEKNNIDLQIDMSKEFFYKTIN